MEETIRTYLGRTRIGPAQKYKNLTVFPLLCEQPADLQVLTLDEALAASLIEVAEVGQGGSVPEIRLTNKSPGLVLVLDGEELVGAKQNRVVNTTILVAGNSTTVIPVSCVEAGRWNYRTDRFYSEERIMSAELRAMKAGQVHHSVREAGSFASDQGAIWDSIEDKARRRKAVSPSMAMSEIFVKEMPSIQDYLGHFETLPQQVGACFLINHRVAGLDSLARPETFSRVFKKLMQSYILDAVDWLEESREGETPQGLAEGFVGACLESRVSTHPSVGLGTDCRLESDKLTGFALVFEGQVVHLSAFSHVNGGHNRGRGTGMESFSSRRRHRR